MNVTLHSQRLDSLPADLLVVGVERGQDSPALAQLDRRLHGLLRAELRHQRFIASDGQVVLFQTHGALPARHVLVVGLGNGVGPRPWYQLSHTITTRAQEVHATRAAVMVPKAHLSPSTLAIVAEGAQLSAYRFDRLKSAAKRHPVRLRQLMMAAAQPGTATRQAMTRARLSAAATCYARDLINLPAAVVTPAYLAAEARRIARQQRLRVRILTSPALRRAGMGAVLGVAQGSTQPPYFIELVYRPRPRARSRPSAPKGSRPTTPPCVALAGKGITFDSGGLSIKTAESMQSQKRDMAGGAAVLAVMSVIRDLEVPVEVRAYIPATENMPSGSAIKPGDVLRAYNGRTIEVLNTDAEGRLVLADALSYAAAAKPDVLIDLATLTAAVRMALGSRYAAIMGTDATLVQQLIAAGRSCGENLWELPLVAEYRADIVSTVADIKNTGEGAAGTIIGGLFLKEFTGSIPWAHIDFSSTVVTDKVFPCHPRGATGFGVRTLIRYLTSLPSTSRSPRQ